MDIDTQYLLLEELPTGVSVKTKHQMQGIRAFIETLRYSYALQKSGKTYKPRAGHKKKLTLFPLCYLGKTSEH